MFGEVTCFHEAGDYEGLQELLGELLQTVQRAGRLLRLLGGHQARLPQRDEGRHRTRVPGTSLVSVNSMLGSHWSVDPTWRAPPPR